MKVEHENLIRTLKNEPTVVSSWLCRFGWHKWTKWKDDTTKILAVHQIRYCAHCNRQQIRRVSEFEK